MALVEVGVVRAINRYPVKSMRGEPMQSATLKWSGLEGDRQYAFVRVQDSSRFPWLTGRNVPDLVLHTARYHEPAHPRTSPLRVTAPDGTEYDLHSPQLAARLSDAAGEAVRLMQVGRGTFDSMPLSCITTRTQANLDRAFGEALNHDRFRINIIVDSEAPETNWLGGSLAFGDEAEPPRLRAACPIPRCSMVRIDPETAALDASVQRMVVHSFGNEVGVYCAADATGTIAVGDRVFLQR